MGWTKGGMEGRTGEEKEGWRDAQEVLEGAIWRSKRQYTAGQIQMDRIIPTFGIHKNDRERFA